MSGGILSSSISLVTAEIELPTFPIILRRSSVEIPSRRFQARTWAGSDKSSLLRTGGCLAQSILGISPQLSRNQRASETNDPEGFLAPSQFLTKSCLAPLVMHKQSYKKNDRKRDTNQPKQSASTKAHDNLHRLPCLINSEKFREFQMGRKPDKNIFVGVGTGRSFCRWVHGKMQRIGRRA